MAADEDAAGGRDPLRQQACVLLKQLEVLGRVGVSEVDRRRRDSGTWTSASGASATAGRVAAATSVAVGDRVEHVLLDRDRDQRAVGAVLGLGAEVECRPLGIGVVAGDQHQLRGAGKRVDPDRPDSTARFASRTQALPGPAITSTGAIVSVP